MTRSNKKSILSNPLYLFVVGVGITLFAVLVLVFILQPGSYLKASLSISIPPSTEGVCFVSDMDAETYLSDRSTRITYEDKCNDTTAVKCEKMGGGTYNIFLGNKKCADFENPQVLEDQYSVETGTEETCEDDYKGIARYPSYMEVARGRCRYPINDEIDSLKKSGLKVNVVASPYAVDDKGFKGVVSDPHALPPNWNWKCIADCAAIIDILPSPSPSSLPSPSPTS